ncbi:MAG: hypothetical protein ABJN65_16945 [Parasphingorhabdus sp.]
MSDINIKLLVFSGSLAIFWSSLVGLFMMIPHLRSSALTKRTSNIDFRQLLAAHLDWIMLGLMQGLAALLIFAFSIKPSIWVVIAMIYGGWMNAVPYFLRAFGINAFVFAGGILAKTANILGGISVFAVIISWAFLLSAAGQTFF